MAEIEGRQLFDRVRSCQRGQREAIVGDLNTDDEFWTELYVETPEDGEIQRFVSEQYQRDGKLLIITGSAGDGKSALLARAVTQAGSGLPEQRVNMDATASTRKDEPYYERLERFLDEVMTDVHQGEGHRSAVAMNYGLAIDFFQRREYADQFPDLWDLLQEARDHRHYERDAIEVLNLSHRTTFETKPDSLGEGLLQQIVDQFDISSSDSPFHKHYTVEREVCPAQEHCPLHKNLEWMADPTVRTTVTQLIASWSIVSGTFLNPRTILDVISTAVLPPELQDIAVDSTSCPVGEAVDTGIHVPSEAYLWNSLFDTFEWDETRLASCVDPAAQDNPETNARVLELSADQDQLHRDVPIDNPVDYTEAELLRTYLRAKYLQGDSVAETLLDWTWFDEYFNTLTLLENPESDIDDARARPVYETIIDALRGWTGVDHSNDRIEFVDGMRSMEFQFFSEWETPQPAIESSQTRSQQETVPGRFWMVLDVGSVTGQQEVPIPMSFDLYLLMKKITQGYTPNTTDLDRSEAIRMIQERLSEMTKKDELVYIRDQARLRELTIKDTGFGPTVDYEVEQ